MMCWIRDRVKEMKKGAKRDDIKILNADYEKID